MIALAHRVKLAALAVALAFIAGPGLAAGEININDGYAVHGYDVVAYFTEGQPVEGVDAYTATHEGATYRFSSAENRDTFAADPGAYAPQYGGYCALGAAKGRKFDGNPQNWAVVDGKLFLNVNDGAQSVWRSDIPGFVAAADTNWPLIQSVPDRTLQSSPPAGIVTN